MTRRILLLATLFCLSVLPSILGQDASSPPNAPIPPGADSSDPAAATRAWLDSVPADKRARSNAYFEGGYWLILWNFLLGTAIAIFLLHSQPSHDGMKS